MLKVKCFPFIFRTEPLPVFYTTVTIVFQRRKILLSTIAAPMSAPTGKKLQIHDLTTVVF